ncbi:unnamed protein product [Zymoseptoria tritici ST99CH_3D7]|uniref:Bicarbonate transporter-like transmembrane domain-containing protein n=1 Tax=Zymoseptoria tritici (strain ST99CH_3D7) TaxID=1276538 RepID=A0A1X7RNK9_ZYMT9|nr:unnamed protein product [Zymoseptoria tritici ST99CH_3D7]
MKERSGLFTRMLRPFTRRDGALRPFRLFFADLTILSRRYLSDWTVFNQVVLASGIFIFFTNLLPGITFASDLYDLTGSNWGTIEIVLSMGICNAVFTLFGLQPLTILGVTGSFTILAEYIYKMSINSFQVDFLSFMAWSLIHACWILWLLAIFNAHEWTMFYVSDFTCEIFSFLNTIIYFSKALQELRRGHQEMAFDAFLYSVVDCVGTFALAVLLSTAEKWKFFPNHLKLWLRQYATIIAVVTFVGIGYVGDAAGLEKNRLQTSSDRLAPSSPTRTTFFVQFWQLPVTYAFVAILPGAIVAMLFFFDHEISTIICTNKRRYGTRKPSGLALDIMLLGVTTALCGLLGVPPSNGLLPQSPLHSESLLHTDKDEEEFEEDILIDRYGIEHLVRKPVSRVYEQRWSKMIQSLAILACIAPPLQKVLGLTPKSVLAGLFMFMGQQSLFTNPILSRTLDLLTPVRHLPKLPPGIARYRPIHGYTLFQVVIAIAVFVVTLTPAAPGFPVIIAALVPFRVLVMPKIWHPATLAHLDKWSYRDETRKETECEPSMCERGGEIATAPLIPSLVALSDFDVERILAHQRSSISHRRSVLSRQRSILTHQRSVLSRERGDHVLSRQESEPMMPPERSATTDTFGRGRHGF